MNTTEESLVSNAAQFLIDGGEEDAASVLLACELVLNYIDTAVEISGDRQWVLMEVELSGNRYVYEILTNLDHPIRQSIGHAFEALSPLEGNCVIQEISAKVKVIDIEPEWRSELLEIARGKGINNQAARAENASTWKNLRFRSGSEIKIAIALEAAGVLFFPNCLARVGPLDSRKNREADFLICKNGKWGILEVDGLPFHQPSRTVQDHERDRLFKIHGITLIEHFDSNECYNEPDRVVETFLQLLARH